MGKEFTLGRKIFVPRIPFPLLPSLPHIFKNSLLVSPNRSFLMFCFSRVSASLGKPEGLKLGKSGQVGLPKLPPDAGLLESAERRARDVEVGVDPNRSCLHLCGKTVCH